MNDKLDYIIAKVDKISDEISEIKVLDATQNEQLAQHMKRSDLLEVRVEQVNAQIKPIQTHVDMIRGILKFLAGVGAVFALLETIGRLF